MGDKTEALRKLGINLDNMEDAEYTSDETALTPNDDEINLLAPPGDFLDIKPFTDRSKQENGKYRFDTKVEAIVHLQTSLDLNDALSMDLTPNYPSVFELMAIPIPTLRSWWKQKDEIIKRGEVLISQLSQVTTLKNNIELLRMQHSLEERDYTQEKLKDLMIAMKTLVVLERVQSTGLDSIKEVRHTHQIQMVEPKRVKK